MATRRAPKGPSFAAEPPVFALVLRDRGHDLRLLCDGDAVGGGPADKVADALPAPRVLGGPMRFEARLPRRGRSSVR
jgi:hypothetical protein